MEEFYTSERANEGIKFPLHLPGGGKTAHWLTIRGVDSDAFQRIERDNKREMAVIQATARTIDDLQKRADFFDAEYERLELRSIAVLISNWSFEQDCSPDNVIAFLKKAPQVKEAVNRLSVNRTLFFGTGLSNSGASQK